MPTVYPLNYQPFLDTNWSVNPGACSDMSYFVQMQDGTLSSVKVDNSSLGFTVTGSDALHGEVFAQVNGTSRFLVFRKSNIDEYTSAGSRTNRGTGYNASTADWSAAAWGNQIIACNYLDATQSSTGAGFTALGGSSPKARYVASNINFVMLADVDDGGSNVFSDMVWWSGIRNPSTYTPSQATQAGNIRLLDAPGPIKQIVAFGDKFVAFKDNAIFVGSYIGPPYVFSWKLIVNNIGLSYPKAVTECDGKLFFAHITGVYTFDGQSIQNIGRGMWAPVESWSTTDTVRIRGDDIQGNVYIGVHNQVVGAFTQNLLYTYSYNCRTGLWARQGLVASSDSGANNPEQPIVYGTTSEYRAFNSFWGLFTGFAYITNAATNKLSFLTSGAADIAPVFTTGYMGGNDNVGTQTRVYLRLRNGSSASTITAATLTAKHDESAPADTTVSGSWNTTISSIDGVIAGRYKTASATFNTNRVSILAGVGFDGSPGGRQ